MVQLVSPATVYQSPSIEYADIAPLLVVFGVAMAGVLVEAFVPRKSRYAVQVVLTIAGLVGALVMAILAWTGADSVASGSIGNVKVGGSIVVDGPALFTWVLLLTLSLLSALLFAERRLEGGLTTFAGQAAALPGTQAEREASAKGLEHTEVFPLLMFSVGGMLLFPASNDFLTMFVALEVFSLPLYLLCGLARRRRLISQESALKYFLLGAFSSGFFLYGMALVYGYAGSVKLAGVAAAVSGAGGGDGLLYAGMALMSVGLLFKVGAVPFHSWTPDVYQGAPTAVTAFMATCTKLAAFVTLLRVFYVGFGGVVWDWQPLFWVVALLTIAVGSIVAITQTDIKRMLAYSSIAHAGFILLGFLGAAAVGSGMSSISAVLFYLAAYGFSTIGAFAVVTVVRDSGGEVTHLSRWAGLGKQSPVLAAVFTLFLLAFAGIPLTSGFTGKWAVFTAAWEGGAWPLVVVAVIASVATAFFYVRVIVLMFFSDPVGDGPTVTRPSILTSAAIAVGAIMTVLLGVVPQPLLDLLSDAGQFIR